MKTNHDIKLGVSLYSYQDNYYFHKHDLEGCIAAAAGAGAEGIEIFSDAMIEEWPYVSDSFIDRFNGLMQRYDVVPVCLDHFSDRAMWHNKQLSDDELYERGVLYIKTARRLGCSSVRLLHHEHIGVGISPYRLTDVSIVERLLPVAAENNIMLALECHAPTSVDDPIHEPYLEAAERLNLPFVGLQADFSSYEYCISTADIVLAADRGGHRETLEFVRCRQREAYLKNEPFLWDEYEETIRKMGVNQFDEEALMMARRRQRPASYETLKQYASKLVYVHGKFYDLDENGQVDNMDYPKIINALKEGGYKGYLCSEFEGNRRLNSKNWCDEIEYVRRHHILMRQCLGYPEPVF